jgi:hypothetical protein
MNPIETLSALIVIVFIGLILPPATRQATIAVVLILVWVSLLIGGTLLAIDGLCENRDQRVVAGAIMLVAAAIAGHGVGGHKNP